jgi:3-oxoacyl-[acyl-carrier protein] reductase
MSNINNPLSSSSPDYTSIITTFIIIIVIIYAIKKLIWDDRPIPIHHRVSKEYYSHSQRRYFLTGCASGVGKHFVTKLLREGNIVIATDINFDGLQHVSDELKWNSPRVKLVKLDVTKSQEWDEAIDIALQFMGKIDVMMNIAGYLAPGSVLTVSDRQIELHCDINLKGVAFGTCKIGRIMAQQVSNGDNPHGTHIINFASLGALAPVSGVGLYIGSKYGCRGFTLSAAKDLFDSGVYCTVVCPDAIQTPMVDLQLHHQASAIAFSGGILTLEYVEHVVFDYVLPHRPREVLIPTSLIRGKMARFGDVFSASLLIAWVEQIMRNAGLQKQQVIKTSSSSSSSSGGDNVHVHKPSSTLDFLDGHYHNNNNKRKQNNVAGGIGNNGNGSSSSNTHRKKSKSPGR